MKTEQRTIWAVVADNFPRLDTFAISLELAQAAFMSRWKKEDGYDNLANWSTWEKAGYSIQEFSMQLKPIKSK